jgi:ribose-phosphate pyrophosphokinase
LLEVMGVDRVIACDLHFGQIRGYFNPNVSVDNLDCSITALKSFADKPLQRPVIVSPDAGGFYRAKKFQGFYTSELRSPSLAVIIKQRFDTEHGTHIDLVGEVRDSDVIIVDDMIDTAGTLCNAAAELKKHGANKIYAFATHGLFSSNAIQRINESPLEQVIITNTVPLRDTEASKPTQEYAKIKQISVGLLLAEAIRRSYQREVLDTLFDPKSFKA